MSKARKVTPETGGSSALVTPWQTETGETLSVERVQLGVRMEKRMVKVLKALAELADTTLGPLLEDIVLHALEGESTYSHEDDRPIIEDLKRIYGMDYGVHGAYSFEEK